MAANAIIRNFSLFINDRKMGFASGHAYDQESGNEIQIGDGVVLGISIGVKTVKIQANAIVPYAGNDVLRVLQDYYNRNKFVQVGVGVLNGQIHKLDLSITAINTKAEMKNGTCMGDYTLIGGAGIQVG